MVAPLHDKSRNARIMASLGGEQFFRDTPMDSPLAVVRMMRQGLSVESADYAREHLGLSHRVFDRVLPRTTIMSARKSKSRTLSKAVSETLFRLVHLTATAEEAFGDQERAHHWLMTPNPVFDNEAPAALADTQAGADWAETVLMRMMYGVDA